MEKSSLLRKIRSMSEEIINIKVRQRSEIQYIQTKEQMEKSSLLRKIRSTSQEIINLKERRPPPTEKLVCSVRLSAHYKTSAFNDISSVSCMC